MKQNEFKLYCKEIADDLAADLRYGNFVDAYVLLEDKIYKNPKIWDNILEDSYNDIILKNQVARAFMSCIYTKEAREVAQNLKSGHETMIEQKDYLEKELEKYIQMDVYEMTYTSRKHLKRMLKSIEKMYNHASFTTKVQVANAPNVDWQEAKTAWKERLDIINNSIQYSKIRAQNAQRIALGLKEIDVQKYQTLQEQEFLDEYNKFHDATKELEERIQELATPQRKIEKYVPNKDKFFDKLVSLHRIKRIPIYILDKMGILDVIKQKKLERKLKQDGVTKEEISKMRHSKSMELDNKEEEISKSKIQINENENEIAYYKKKETVEKFAQLNNINRNRSKGKTKER